MYKNSMLWQTNLGIGILGAGYSLVALACLLCMKEFAYSAMVGAPVALGTIAAMLAAVTVVALDPILVRVDKPPFFVRLSNVSLQVLTLLMMLLLLGLEVKVKKIVPILVVATTGVASACGNLFLLSRTKKQATLAERYDTLVVERIRRRLKKETVSKEEKKITEQYARVSNACIIISAVGMLSFWENNNTRFILYAVMMLLQNGKN